MMLRLPDIKNRPAPISIQRPVPANTRGQGCSVLILGGW
jgi:hypothetical protein